MRVYGFDSSDVLRGELQLALVDPIHAEERAGSLASQLEWDFASTSFAKAKTALVDAMKTESVDPELISTVRSFKACFVPVTLDLT